MNMSKNNIINNIVLHHYQYYSACFVSVWDFGYFAVLIYKLRLKGTEAATMIWELPKTGYFKGQVTTLKILKYFKGDDLSLEIMPRNWQPSTVNYDALKRIIVLKRIIDRSFSNIQEVD